MHARTLNETEPQAKAEFSYQVYYEHLASESELSENACQDT